MEAEDQGVAGTNKTDLSKEAATDTNGGNEVSTGPSQRVTIPNVPASTGAIKKRHEEKARRKDPKSWENLEKCLIAVSPVEKILSLKTKYQDLYNDYRAVVNTNQALTRQNNTLQREKDASQSELQKNLNARSRLENLCREMQKQNRQIKDEHQTILREEDERRRDASVQFTDKLNHINTMMEANKKKSEKLRDENLSMASKLSELYGQFKIREEDINQMGKQLEVEKEYSKVTLEKLQLEIAAQRETHQLELEEYKRELQNSQTDCATLAATVESLQESISIYRNQYSDFESTMNKSTQAFDNFKTEFATMTRQSSRLEKEVELWKLKYHECMTALIELTENKKQLEIHDRKMEVKVEKLTKLCRKLQQDRAFFLCTLKANKIEPGVVPPFEIKSTPPKTKKEKELEELKDNLKVVQEELKRISEEESKSGPSTSSAVVEAPCPPSQLEDDDVIALTASAANLDFNVLRQQDDLELAEATADDGDKSETHNKAEQEQPEGEPSTGTPVSSLPESPKKD